MSLGRVPDIEQGFGCTIVDIFAELWLALTVVGINQLLHNKGLLRIPLNDRNHGPGVPKFWDGARGLTPLDNLACNKLVSHVKQNRCPPDTIEFLDKCAKFLAATDSCDCSIGPLSINLLYADFLIREGRKFWCRVQIDPSGMGRLKPALPCQSLEVDIERAPVNVNVLIVEVKGAVWQLIMIIRCNRYLIKAA